MSNAPEWKCGQCAVVNEGELTRCIACEEPRFKPVYDGPPILFGGGPAAPLDLSKPPSLSAGADVPVLPAPQIVPTAPTTTFCTAMTTPIRTNDTSPQSEFLHGILPHELVDKSVCVGSLKIQPGPLVTWGCGECEQLPIKSELLDEYQGLLKPAPIKAFEDGSAVMICCGSLTSYVVKTNNELWSWGCNDNGPLGRPVKGQSSVEAFANVPPPYENCPIVSGKVPQRVWGLPQEDKIVKIVAGDSHAGVLTESGDVWLWGHYRDFTGPLGFWQPEANGSEGRIVHCQYVPVKLQISGVALDIASGENHTVILVEQEGNRHLVVLGSNEFGQLCTLPSAPPLPEAIGGPTTMQSAAPMVLTPIEITPEKYQDIRHQYLRPHVLPVDQLKYRKFVSGHFSDVSLSLKSAKLTKVSAGSATTFLKLVAENGESMWCACGRGCHGELGGGFTDQASYEPTLISIPALCIFETIVGGDFATFGLATDGSIWAWGKAELCGLGNSNPQDNITVPTAIPGLRNKIHSIVSGMKTAYAVSHEGYVLVWGEGNNYQLGNGTLQDETVIIPTCIPRDLFNGSSVVAVAAGATHAVALTNSSIEWRGAKRTRVEEPDEPPSFIKKSRAETDQNQPGVIAPIVETPPTVARPPVIVNSPMPQSQIKRDFQDQKLPDRTPNFSNLDESKLEPIAEESSEQRDDGSQADALTETKEVVSEQPLCTVAVTRIHKNDEVRDDTPRSPVADTITGRSLHDSSAKPRDSLTAVLISPERPFNTTPKPSEAETEPVKITAETELERERLEEEMREEETITATAKGRAKGKAKAKAKTKAKAKAKGRPGRKPAAAKAQENSEKDEEDEETLAAEEVPARKTRRPRAAGRGAAAASRVASGSSSDVESDDEEKPRPRGRGKAKAKASARKK